MSKKVFRSFLASCLFFAAVSAHAGVAGALGDVISKGSDEFARFLDDVLQIKGGTKREVANAFYEALGRLNKGAVPSSVDEVGSVLRRSLKEQGDDLLIGLLRKNADQIQMDDFAKLFTRIAKQADMPVAPSVRHMLVAIPTKPRDLLRAIDGKVRGLRLANFKHNAGDDELGKLYRALDLMQTGSKEQKAFADAYRAFNTAGTKTFYEKNDMWTAVVDSEPRELQGITDLLNRIAKQEPMDADGRLKNLDVELQRLADDAKVKNGDDSLQEALEQWRKKGCWKPGSCKI